MTVLKIFGLFLLGVGIVFFIGYLLLILMGLLCLTAEWIHDKLEQRKKRKKR